MQIWIDGKKVAENSDVKGTIPITNDPLYIGTKRRDAPPGDWFYGLIGKMKIYY